MADKYISLNRLHVITNWIKDKLSYKQDALTAGDGLKIENDIISGTKVDVSKGSTNIIEVESYNSSKLGFEFSQDDIVLTASSPMVFGENRTLQEKLIAGDNIKIENNTISADEKIFYATKDITTAQELIAAFNAGKIIMLRQMRIDNTYPFVVAQFAVHNASHCSIVVYNVNGMTLSNGIMVMKYSVVNGAWTLNMQNLQNKLESGTDIKTINNQSLLGSGNIDIGGGTVDTSMSDTSENAVQNKVIKDYIDTADDNLQLQLGTLTDLTTDNKDSLVNAINEVYEKSGEPFRVKNWASNTLNVEMPTCTEDISNTAIPKMVFSIDNVEGADYQIVGMLAYEVFDTASGGNRINCWPVCQFTGNGQKELSVRWMCAGTTRKTAKRINAWILLKHR